MTSAVSVLFAVFQNINTVARDSLEVAVAEAREEVIPRVSDEEEKEFENQGDLNSDVERRVREYFADVPTMIEIARCESRFRQYAPDTSVLRGRVNRSDVGVMQINTYYHGTRAKVLGHDLYTLEGNLAYARNLYEHKGFQPWNASRSCWDR